MNTSGIRRYAFATRDEMRRSSIPVPVSDRTVVCPKPRRIGVLDSIDDHPVESLGSELSQAKLCESDSGSGVLDILKKGGGSAVEQDCGEAIASSPLFFTGSPPCRVSNPLTKDSRFREGLFIAPSPPFPLPPMQPPSSPSSGRTGGCIRANFGNNPAVRIVGFDCLDRDRRSIPALA